jgi:hypothetical protein
MIARMRLTHHGTKTKSSAREDFRRGMVDRDAAKFMPAFQVFFRSTEVQGSDMFAVFMAHSRSGNNSTEFGATTRRLAMMNLAIRGGEANLIEEQAQTFRRDLHPDLRQPALQGLRLVLQRRRPALAVPRVTTSVFSPQPN